MGLVPVRAFSHFGNAVNIPGEVIKVNKVIIFELFGDKFEHNTGHYALHRPNHPANRGIAMFVMLTIHTVKFASRGDVVNAVGAVVHHAQFCSL